MAGMFAPATYWPLIQKTGVRLTPSFVPISLCSRRSASAPAILARGYFLTVELTAHHLL